MRQRFKHSIQSGMRNANRCTLQQFNLRSRADDNRIGRNTTEILWTNILADRKYNLNIFQGPERFKKDDSDVRRIAVSCANPAHCNRDFSTVSAYYEGQGT
jgi:hypothetical protein